MTEVLPLRPTLARPGPAGFGVGLDSSFGSGFGAALGGALGAWLARVAVLARFLFFFGAERGAAGTGPSARARISAIGVFLPFFVVFLRVAMGSLSVARRPGSHSPLRETLAPRRALSPSPGRARRTPGRGPRRGPGRASRAPRATSRPWTGRASRPRSA